MAYMHFFSLGPICSKTDYLEGKKNGESLSNELSTKSLMLILDAFDRALNNSVHMLHIFYKCNGTKTLQSYFLSLYVIRHDILSDFGHVQNYL